MNRLEKQKMDGGKDKMYKPWEFILSAKVHGLLPIFMGLSGKASNDVGDDGQPVYSLLEEVNHPGELSHCVLSPHVSKNSIAASL